MNRLVRVLTCVVLGGAVLVSSGGPLGCGDGDGSGTTGRRISLDVQIAASPGSRELTNAKGWKVVLSKALVSTGALYFYDGEPLFAAGRPRGGFELVRSAFAHPGHYVPGNAKGELRTGSSVDLLAGATLGGGEGVTGLVQSATFGFGVPPAGPLSAELGANVIVLEGTATKDAETRVFRAEIAPSELSDDPRGPQIEGCPFARAEMQGDGTVAVTIDLPMWLAQVDFTEVPASTDGAPVRLEAGLAKNQLVRGVKAGLAYRFAFAPRREP